MRTAVIGSVALDLVGVAPCPVVVVPPTVADRGPTAVTGAGLVCALAGADDAAPAAVAARLTRGLGGRLTAVHVLDGGEPERIEPARGGPMLPVAQQYAAVTQQDTAATPAVRAIRERLAELTGNGHDVALRVRSGPAARAVRDVAAEESAELIVVGSRRRGAVTSALLGSVSRELAREADRPVVICPEQR